MVNGKIKKIPVIKGDANKITHIYVDGKWKKASPKVSKKTKKKNLWVKEQLRVAFIHHKQNIFLSGHHFDNTYYNFFNIINERKKNLLDVLQKLNSDGKKIIGYGAPAKATTLLNFFNTFFAT